MIEVKIAGIQVSLVSQNRLVLLKELDVERYLPIWIGPCEADAISAELQNVERMRPMTHDLLKNVIETLGGVVQHILVTEMRGETFYARILISVGGRTIEIDSRPSDAMALAVRTQAPIYVAEQVMDSECITPDQDLSKEGEGSAFDAFLGSLDIDNMPIH